MSPLTGYLQMRRKGDNFNSSMWRSEGWKWTNKTGTYPYQKKITYGFPDRSMAVHERTKKILARSHHHRPASAWPFDRIRWKQRCSAFYLYLVLTIRFRRDVRRLIGHRASHFRILGCNEPSGSESVTCALSAQVPFTAIWTQAVHSFHFRTARYTAWRSL